jgi:ankyrin repeat protein
MRSSVNVRLNGSLRLALVLCVCRQTLLHAAALYSRDDCVKLLLAAGVSAAALDAEGRSALQLACLHRSQSTVCALLNNGGWLPELAFDCLLNACIAGDATRLELLLEHASKSRSSSNSNNSSSSSTSSSNSSSSSAITDLVSGTTAEGEYTLLHAAAAWGRLQCVGILLRHRVSASGLTGAGKSPAALAAAGIDEVPAQLQREGVKRPAGAERQKVVLLLLRSGAAVETDLMCYDCYSGAVQQRIQELEQQLAAQTEAVTLLAVNAYRSDGVAITASSTNNSSDTEQQQRRADTADVTAKQHIARVQLMHATTGERAHTVYTIDTKLLAALHTLRGETGVSVLANMLVAPSSWGAAASTAGAAANAVKYLQYNDDVDFSELGFECVLQYYYTASVQGATSGAVDIDKLQATLQAAQFFGLDNLAAAAKDFAKASGVIIQ